MLKHMRHCVFDVDVAMTMTFWLFKKRNKYYHYYSPAKWIFTGSFELAILRMSRYYELNQNCVLYADTLLPQEAFYTTDPNEQKLVALAFEVARGVAELKLTETELALYSACVLLSPGNGFGMKRIVRVLTVVRKLQESFILIIRHYKSSQSQSRG